jgi:hypothetical protein
MVRKLILLSVWFPFAYFIILVNLSYVPRELQAIAMDTQTDTIISPLASMSPFHITAAAGTSKVLGTDIIAADAREHLIADFLYKHDSPMAPYANVFVEEADKHNIDYRLVVAIAMCESNLGKRIPKDSYNAWGIAVYTGQQSGANFQDWPTAIRWVSKYMKERYLDRGHDTLREIGSIYAPPSVETGHSWARCVEEFQTGIF